MEHVIALQILIGAFCGFMARKKGRSAAAWGIAGALIPVLPVIFIIALGPPRVRPPLSDGPGRRTARTRPTPPRPRRCCGSYIPDCQGCPYFRRALFREEDRVERGYRGYCEYFDYELTEQEEDNGPTIVYED